MKTIGTSVTKGILSPVSRGCKQNVTLSFFMIPILSILLYSACSFAVRGGANTKVSPLGPLIITSYAQLKDIKNSLNEHYRLGGDIDASASWNENDTSATCVAYDGSNGETANCRGFSPVGTYVRNNANVAFTGSFDGAGYKITSLYIKRPSADFVGLFGSIASHTEIKDLGVTDAYIVGKDGVGGLIGRSDGSVSNSYAMGTVTGRNSVGGLIGSSGSSVSNSYATGAVTGTFGTGGLIGWAFSGSVSNSYATGNVTGKANSVGGLIGSSGSFVSNSYATGAVTGTGNNVGGFIGYSYDDSVINSYATGAVTGRDNVGGLIGRSGGSVSNSYATGAVMGTGTTVGGFIGEYRGSVTRKNYFVDASGTNGIGSGKVCSSSVCVSQTAAQIAALTTASGWTVNTSGGTGNWNFGTTAQLPAVLYSGTDCETISGTNDINRNQGAAKKVDCGDIIKGQR